MGRREMMDGLRTLLFHTIFYGGSVPIVLLAPAAALFGDRPFRNWVVFWTAFHAWCARNLAGITTRIDGRHVLIVVRGYHYKDDLVTLRPYIRECRPVLIGVDGGADAILEAGWTPDLIVGDMDSVSDRGLRCGAEIVVHAYRDGRAPGLARIEQLGVPHVVFPATGTSEDVAMLLADDKGAELIVAVGTHATLVEFLDKGRSGMASTFLTRLRVGGKLVDAKGVSRLYRTRISNLQLTLLSLAGLLALVVALAATQSGQTLLGLFGARLDDLYSWIRTLLGLTR